MTKEKIENNPIVRHTFEFALLINGYCPKLQDLRFWDLSRQLFRAGSSIGANVWEAQNSESTADFIHKMKIAAKEANETLFWLMLCDRTPNYPDCKELLAKLGEIQRLLNAIITSAKRSKPLGFFIGYLYFLLKPASTIFLNNQI